MKPYVKPCGDGAIGKFLMQWCELAYLIGSAPHPAYILHDSCGLLACHARLRAFPPQALFLLSLVSGVDLTSCWASG